MHVKLMCTAGRRPALAHAPFLDEMLIIDAVHRLLQQGCLSAQGLESLLRTSGA